MNDTQSMGSGSENLIVTGTGANQVFKGIAQRTASPSNPVGTKVLTNVGDKYGGLGNFADTALGSIFRVLGAIFFIGSGRLYYDGADTGVSASSTLSLRRLVNGVLGTTYQAGLAQPSAPVITAITPPAGFVGKNDGTVSVKLARVRSATGARSIASLASNVATCRNQSVLVEFPSADLNGQDYWEVDVTLNGYGGVGNHYFFQEIAESALIGSTSLTPTATIVSGTTLSMPNGTLTASNVGWAIESTAQWESVTCAVTTVTAGNAKTVVTAAGMTGSPKTITFALAGGETAAQVATALYNALNGDADITAIFNVYKDSATVYLKKKVGTDSTVNFTLEDDTTTGITDVVASTPATIATYITAVGANNSASTGNQLITINASTTLPVSQTESVLVRPIVTAVSGTTVSLPNGTLTASNVGWKIEGSRQWEYLTVVVNSVVGGNAKTVVTAAGMTGSPKTITFAVTTGDSAATVASKLYNALNGDAAVTAVFDVYNSGANVYLRKKTGTDTTVNFTIDNDTSTGISTLSTSSTGTIATWITAVGANDSASSGNQLITLNSTIGVYPTATESVTLTRGVNGVPRSYAFEWRDADLAGADLAPIYDYPPPAGLFGGVIGDVTFVDGALGDTVNTATNTANANPIAYPGNVIAISEPARPESFPFSNYIFTNDSPVALLEGSQGLYWRFGKNSLGVLRYIGGSPAISYERIWTGAGIVNQKNATLGGGGRLYAYTGARGAVRMGTQGELDTSFASRVADDMASWTPANVVLGYDANYQYVFYAHNKTILAYFEPMDLWSAPLNLSATLGTKNILAMVTYNSEVYIAAGDSGGINLYSFNTGTGTTAKLVTQWQQTGGEFDILSRIKLALRSDTTTTATLKGYVNGESTAANTQVFDISSGLSVPTTLRPNIRNARIWRLETTMTSAGGDAGIETITVDGDTSDITT